MNTKTARHSLDMLHGSLIKKILLFALPIAASSILQQLFNSADTAVAGQFGNADALAAVGTNGEIVALIVGICVGIAVGANVLIAKFIGAGSATAFPAQFILRWLSLSSSEFCLPFSVNLQPVRCWH